MGLSFIPSPTVSGFHIGPLEIHFYALMYIIGIAAAIAITRRRWRAQGGDPDLVLDVALWSVPAGIIGGRIYFDITTPQYIPHHWYGVFEVWSGGLGIWGGIAVATAVGIWRLRRHHADVRAFMDAVAPGLLVAQAIGRIGNYFNKELYGGPSSLPWALKIPPAYRYPGYEKYTAFQPTFLYELIFDLALAAFLIWLGHHRRIRPPGLFALYVTGYSAYRIFEELLRVDPSEHFLGLRLNLFIASALTVAGAIWFIHTQRLDRRPVQGATVLAIAATLGAAMAGCGSLPHATAAPGNANPPPPAAAAPSGNPAHPDASGNTTTALPV
jgi:prolipoprotein diacylglyceryl transferase